MNFLELIFAEHTAKKKIKYDIYHIFRSLILLFLSKIV
jgi:hypothetical protein